jgi:hypothetical protein
MNVSLSVKNQSNQSAALLIQLILTSEPDWSMTKTSGDLKNSGKIQSRLSDEIIGILVSLRNPQERVVKPISV